MSYFLSLPCAASDLSAELYCERAEAMWRVSDPEEGLACHQLQEQRSYELIVSPVRSGAAIEARFGGVSLVPRVLENTAIMRLEPKNYVGRSHLQLTIDGLLCLSLPLEVRSRKLDYLTHYRDILDALADWVAAVALSHGAPTDLQTAPTSGRVPPYVGYLLLRRMMQRQEIPAAVELIASHPDRRLVRETRVTEFSRARYLTAKSLQHLVSQPGELQRVHSPGVAGALQDRLGGRLPTRLQEERSRVDFNTPANRYVKHVIERLQQRTLEIERALKPSSPELAARCRGWSRQASLWRNLSFLGEVGQLSRIPAESQVLLRRSGYRQFPHWHRQLEQTLRVRWKSLEKLLSSPQKDLAKLYEYWCLLVLAEEVATRLGLRVDWSRCLRFRDDVYQLSLRNLKLSIGNWILNYEKTFVRPRGSYSVPLRPDYSLRSGSQQWVFDAKYRLDSQVIQQEFSPEPLPRRYTPTDIYKMHTYRDALRGTRGAFILYPGDVFRAFGTRGETYFNPNDLPEDFQGVGAVPLLPGHTEVLAEVLRRLL